MKNDGCMAMEESKSKMAEESKSDDSTSSSSSSSLPAWVLSLPVGEAARKENWPPLAVTVEFDWSQPTYEVYSDPNYLDFTPYFKQARQKLDYSYHRNPARSPITVHDPRWADHPACPSDGHRHRLSCPDGSQRRAS